MIELHPEALEKDGKKEFVALQAILADAEDALDLRAAKQEEQDAPTISLAEVKSSLAID